MTPEELKTAVTDAEYRAGVPHDEFSFRLASLRANALSPRKRTLSDADLAQADAIYSDAHRAGREDVKAEVRTILDQTRRSA